MLSGCTNAAMSASCRYSAVVLIAGWLLMLPPHGEPSAPVQTWKQEAAFDNAHACEEARNEGLSNLLRLKEASIKAGTAELPAFKKSNEDLQEGIDDYTKARCIPGEHIYPPTQNTPSK